MCWFFFAGFYCIKYLCCIIIYLSFLNCDWLLHPRSTVVLLDTVEKFTMRIPMVKLELATPGLQTQCSSHWAIQLSKAIAGKELSLSSWCIASLYIYHFSTVIDFSSEKYIGSTGHRNSWYQWRKVPEKFTVRMPMVRLELELLPSNSFIARWAFIKRQRHRRDCEMKTSGKTASKRCKDDTIVSLHSISKWD